MRPAHESATANADCAWDSLWAARWAERSQRNRMKRRLREAVRMSLPVARRRRGCGHQSEEVAADLGLRRCCERSDPRLRGHRTKVVGEAGQFAGNAIGWKPKAGGRKPILMQCAKFVTLQLLRAYKWAISPLFPRGLPLRADLLRICHGGSGALRRMCAADGWPWPRLLRCHPLRTQRLRSGGKNAESHQLGKSQRTEWCGLRALEIDIDTTGI